MPDLYTEQLSAYLDGELDVARRRRLEAHLTQCPECAELLADLRAIVSAAPHYSGRAPSRDLWSDIEARLDKTEVLELRQRERPSRRFGWGELIAASLLMAAVGGGASWLALRVPSARPTDRPSVLTVRPSDAADSLKTVAYAEAQYDAAVRDLEQVLDAGRSQLDTATVRTIELSLVKIDAAIAEARAAVQRDPANEYLSRQIAANMRRKLNLLRIATNAIART